MFDASAECSHWEQDTAAPPTASELEFLNRDLKKWVPQFPILFRGTKILDLGAGRGILGALVADRYAPTLTVSLDIGFHRLRVARNWVRDLQNFAVICGDAFQLPFRDESFDYVIANSLLHHFPELDRATAEVARVLRPGGYYLGREPNFDNPIVRAHVFKLDGTWWRRHARISPNEYPLRAKQIRDSFRRAECSCDLKYFWRRFKYLRHPILSVAISVRAQRAA